MISLPWFRRPGRGFEQLTPDSRKAGVSHWAQNAIVEGHRWGSQSAGPSRYLFRRR